jgi:hypothetical protein
MWTTAASAAFGTVALPTEPADNSMPDCNCDYRRSS